MKNIIYPKNKRYFKRLLPFAKKIILICQKNDIIPVIYGSFSHFYWTRDENMKVNDIDILVHKKNLSKVLELLEENRIKHKYYPKYGTIIIKKGKLKVEIDEVWSGYKTLKDKSLTKNVKNIDFYGIKVKIITLKQIEEIYPMAYNRSKDNKVKILKKIKHLENFLGRKLI